MTTQFNFITRLRDAYMNREEPENIRPLAQSYWRILLVVSFVALIGIFTMGIEELLTVLNDLNIDASSTSAGVPSSFDPATLDSILQVYQTRQSQLGQPQTSSVSIPDPSK